MLKEERTKNVGGTGLGLHICKNICEALGGWINIQSTENVGSTFTFAIEVKDI